MSLNLFRIALLRPAINPDLLIIIIQGTNFRNAGFMARLAPLAQIVSAGAFRKNLHDKLCSILQTFLGYLPSTGIPRQYAEEGASLHINPLERTR